MAGHSAAGCRRTEGLALRTGGSILAPRARQGAAWRRGLAGADSRRPAEAAGAACHRGTPSDPRRRGRGPRRRAHAPRSAGVGPGSGKAGPDSPRSRIYTAAAPGPGRPAPLRAGGQCRSSHGAPCPASARRGCRSAALERGSASSRPRDRGPSCTPVGEGMVSTQACFRF